MLSQEFRLFQLSKVDENAMVWSEKISCIAVSYEVSAHIRRQSKQNDTGMEYLRTYAEKIRSTFTILRIYAQNNMWNICVHALTKRYGHGIFADVRENYPRR